MKKLCIIAAIVAMATPSYSLEVDLRSSKKTSQRTSILNVINNFEVNGKFVIEALDKDLNLLSDKEYRSSKRVIDLYSDQTLPGYFKINPKHSGEVLLCAKLVATLKLKDGVFGYERVKQQIRACEKVTYK